MTNDFHPDRDLEARLRRHYDGLEPGAPAPGWTSRVDAALASRRPAIRPARSLLAVAAALALMVGAVAGLGLLDKLTRIAAPSPSLPGPTLPAAPSGSPSASSLPAGDAAVDLAGTFAPHGVWAIRGGQLLVSADAGASWRTGTAPRPQTGDGFGVRVATMLTAEVGWVVTSGPGTTAFDGAPTDRQSLVVSRTTDGGQTWSNATVPGNFPGVSVSISFIDSLRGFILLTPVRGSLTVGAVLATNDGGASWRTTGRMDTWARGGMNPWLGTEFTASDATTLWAGANQEAGPVQHPLLAVSRDGGATWRDAALPAAPAVAGGPQVYVPSPATFGGNGAGRVAIVNESSPDGTVSTQVDRTDDGGTTWRVTATIPQAAITNPVALDATHWLLGVDNPSQLLASSDGGATWSAVAGALPAGWWLQGAGAIDAEHAMLLASPDGSQATVLLLSSDGGKTWLPPDLGPAPAATPTPQSSPAASLEPSPSASAIAPTASASPGPLFGPIDIQPLPSPSLATALGPGWQTGWLAVDANGMPTGWRWDQGRSLLPFAPGTFGDVASAQAVALGGALLVLVEDPQGTDTVWRSSDGANWSSAPVDRLRLVGDSLATNGTTVVAVRNPASPGIVASADGVAWQTGSTVDGSSFEPQSVAAFRGGFVAVGSQGRNAAAWTSSDGIHWRAATVRQGGQLTLVAVWAGPDGLAAMSSTGGTPGLFAYWTGTLDGTGALTFAPSSADPLGISSSGEGVGSAEGLFTGDGSRIVVWGTPGSATEHQLWASLDGQHWHRITIASGSSLVADAGGPTLVGGDLLFQGASSGPWIGVPASP